MNQFALLSRAAVRRGMVSLLMGTVVLPGVCLAEAYRPGSDGEVLETLPRVLFESRDQLSTWRRDLAADPTNLDLALKVASAYLLIGKREGDPRFFGYATAALGPWWGEASPPPAVLRLRAKLRERDHDYAGALADLGLLLEAEPRDVQAWLETSNLHWVRGDYDLAGEASGRIEAIGGALPVILSRVPIDAVTGRGEEAYGELALALALPVASASASDPGVLQWVYTMQADIARALGRDVLAEGHFRDGLAADPGDLYLLRSYTDLLLDHDRAAEVIPLVEAHLNDTGLLLRAAIAARRIGDAERAATWTDQLERRFEEIRLRGGQPHGRYEARFVLELKNDPQLALKLAEANWQQQKQARDTRTLLEAALAAGRAEAAAPAVAFIERWGTQDAVLEAVVDRLDPDHALRSHQPKH